MQFRIHITDPARWHMSGVSSGVQEDAEFREWISDMYPECLYLYRFNHGNPFWELRGGDLTTQSLIILRWSTEKTG